MKEQGCVSVDMELSALLAVAKYREIDFAEFLICEDAVGDCNPDSLPRNNNATLQTAIDICNKL